MKIQMNKLHVMALLGLILGYYPVKSQTLIHNDKGWVAKKTFESKVFIENKGQFNNPDGQQLENVKYAVNNGNLNVYFTPTGLSYHVIDMQVKAKYEKDKEEAFEKIEKYIHKNGKPGESLRKYFTDNSSYVHIEWLGANPNAQIEVSDKVYNHYSYSVRDKSGEYKPVLANAYKKLTYKNIYPGIDIEYYFPENSDQPGIEYNIVVHPGGDLSQVKMRYNGQQSLSLDKNGNIVALIPDGNITDHAPAECYNGNNKSIAGFILNNQTVSFRVATYDKSKELVIDPVTTVWNKNPGFTTTNAGYTIRIDYYHNVYVMGGGVKSGGVIPSYNYQVEKFNASGVLQWTAVVTSSNEGLYGDMVVLRDGKAIVGMGFGGGNTGYIIAPANGAITTVNVPNENEFGWRFSYNLALNNGILWYGSGSDNGIHLAKTDTNLSATTHYCPWGSASNTEDICYLAQDNAGSNIYVTNSSNSNPNSSATALKFCKTAAATPATAIWKVNEHTNMLEGGQAKFINGGPGGFLSGWATGVNGMIAYGSQVYTYDGNIIRAYNTSTGAIIDTVVSGGTFAEYSGIDIDSCHRVYIGSKGEVKRYSTSLAFDVNIPTPGDVYDLRLDPQDPTTLYVTGNGFVEKVSLASYCATCIKGSEIDAGCGKLGSAEVDSITDPGATPPYTYSWNTGQTTDSIGSLSPGTYIVTVTDNSSGCPLKWRDTLVVKSAPGSFTVAVSPNNASCGLSNGSATATPSPSGTYTYQWSDGQTTQTATGLAAGTYTVIVNSGGCIDTTTVAISNNGGPIATSSITDPKCNGGTGSATVNSSGGSSPYTYSWSPSGGTNATATGLSPGTYTCTITDKNGCSTADTITITEPSPITGSVSSVTQANCGSSNGSITITASGGTGSLSYNWSPSGGNAATANNLAAGTYTCTVTDANGCSKTVIASVSNIGGPTVTSSSSSPKCNGGTGTATVSVSGGTGPYTYSWSPSGGTDSVATGLSAGTYTCTVTDNGGCITNDTVVITQPAAIVGTSSITNASCGQSDGSATITTTGGSGTYTYSWSPSGGNAATASGLAAGTYTCTITDGNGCSKQVVVPISNIGAPTITASNSNDVCFGDNNGSATVTATGGTSPYTYAWSPSGGSAATASGLAAGTYTCTVTDSKGCITTDTVIITQPSAITSSITKVNADCGKPGSVSITTSGGTGGYTYSWSPSGGTGPTVNNLSAGSYTCTVTDANGCTQTQVATITGTPGATATINPGDVTINLGDSLTLTAGGGNTYQWKPSTGLSCTNCPNPVAKPSQTTQYCVTVTDSNGCTDSTCIRISVEIPCGQVFVPSAFSPNGDVQNDLECVYGNCIQTIDFAIYDRWGNKVFETTDPANNCWDGKFKGQEMNTAVFVYFLKATLFNGDKVSKQGNITLIR